MPFFSSPVLTGNSSESVCVTAVNGDVLQYRCLDGSKVSVAAGVCLESLCRFSSSYLAYKYIAVVSIVG